MPPPPPPQKGRMKRAGGEEEKAVFKKMRKLMDTAEAERLAMLDEKEDIAQAKHQFALEKVRFQEVSALERRVLARHRDAIGRNGERLRQEDAALTKAKERLRQEKAKVQQACDLAVMCESLRAQKDRTLKEMAQLRTQYKKKIHDVEVDRDSMRTLRDEAQEKLDTVAKQLGGSVKSALAERDQLKKERDELEAKYLDAELERHIMEGERDEQVREEKSAKKEDLERNLGKAVADRDTMEKERDEALAELAKLRNGMKNMLCEA
ncbi:hypothetical protein P154DRAFT_616527 [Amniculicola lignicola CBS 123094]|uniref:Uncharacterized protein n=1 Tax=Amniculicola lignicola CBS 123094 TaxID=1392246 RepID=A0A6A5X2D7_9PLEO|nr:hypothetical protein P154DRAFT_616527 [Amniculicola lignicola CBS 123094]